MQQSALTQQARGQAERQVARFVLRFEPAYQQLAYYAALPLVLTPELLHYLRSQFLASVQLPWEAEADLLLSDLCHSVWYEQYAMDTAVRAYLIAELEQVFGVEHLGAVAKLLLRYVEQLEQLNPYLSRQELESQQMSALVYVGEAQQAQVAERLAKAYQQVAAVGPGQRLPVAAQAEMARLSRLTSELAPKLQAHQPLLDYAQLVSQLLADSSRVSEVSLRRSYEVARGITLQVPEDLMPEKGLLGKMSLAGFPALESFDFIEAHLVEESVNSRDKAVAAFPPLLQIEDFTVVTFEASLSVSQQADITLPSHAFDFTIAILERQDGQRRPQQQVTQKENRGQSAEWVIRREQSQAYGLLERLPADVVLEMVAIPAGTLIMGSPNDEPERYGDEAPQHEVSVDPFFMGRYPVTQAQWRTVAGLPQVDRELKAAPSQFKGDSRPVEQVSWHDAVEFCVRLSAHTGREYRLPTEAEWEYACRAGTTTPFHFGEMITTDVANYDGSAYAKGPKGKGRNQTTPIDQFDCANAFGLSEMHGNVWEWCADHWHGNYEGAPVDGRAWLTDNDGASRVNRGGAWNNDPRYCRSAIRDGIPPGDRDNVIGFRVSCSAPRTQ